VHHLKAILHFAAQIKALATLVLKRQNTGEPDVVKTKHSYIVMLNNYL
jgi:hypothetical protein